MTVGGRHRDYRGHGNRRVGERITSQVGATWTILLKVKRRREGGVDAIGCWVQQGAVSQYGQRDSETPEGSRGRTDWHAWWCNRVRFFLKSVLLVLWYRGLQKLVGICM